MNFKGGTHYDSSWSDARGYRATAGKAKKVWEVVKLVGGYYLRQYISGQQVGRGMKTSKKFIKSIGVFEFEEVGGIAG